MASCLRETQTLCNFAALLRMGRSETKRFTVSTHSPLSLLRLLFQVTLVFRGLTAHAEQPFSFDTTPGRLPKDVVPHRYRIHIEPHVAEETVRGEETIALEVRKPVHKVVLNAIGYDITHVSLRTPGGLRMEMPGHMDEQTQLLTLDLPSELPAGEAELELHWSGRLNEQPQGLHLTRFSTEAGERTALASQMEATDARRMFPCWDEPAFRAVYELSAVVPASFLAVSNMPLVSERPFQAGWKEVQFAPTPAMASYLVAFCAGEFETLSDEVAGVKLRVITTPGKKEQGRYALEATKKILTYYNDYFGLPYPLPKLDQFCFPGFAAGGMENWGAIFYNDTTLLVDPKVNSQHARQRVFYVIAHEIAHQWFGDLVTMAWWDNLWLNEGFASWMGTKTADHFNPDWHVWLRSAGDKEWAMHRDARATTHPIQQPVQNEAQASDAFDEITYSKGQSFLRMLESYLGEEPFRAGIRLYVKRHALSNTTTADLWAALEEASGKSVRELAAQWTEQPGFPLVEVKSERGADRQQVTFTQERFTIHQGHPKPLTWLTPVTWATVGSLAHPHTDLLGPKALTVSPEEGSGPVKVNAGAVGYFRAAYDDVTLAGLLRRLPELPEADRLELLVDEWALVQAERAPISLFLGLSQQFAAQEKSVPVWSELVWILQSIDHLQRGEPSQPAWRAWARSLVQPEFQRLGWDALPDESELTPGLRADLVRALGNWGDPAILAEAARRFDTFLQRPEEVAADLRPALFELAGQQADAAGYERLHARARAERSFIQRRDLYRGLTFSHDPALASRTLALSLTDELPPPDAARLVEQVAENGELPELAWVFAQQNLAPLYAKLASIRQNDYLPSIARSFNDASWADELEHFANAHLPAAAAPFVARSTDEIRFKAEFKAKTLPELAKWIGEHGGK